MSDNEEKPYLSETIDYDRDIAPYQFIKIFSGVGSGKNVFVDKLARGKEFMHTDGAPVKKQHLLLITSRRAKADEQLNEEDSNYDSRIGAVENDPWSWMFDYTDPDPEFIQLKNPNVWGEPRSIEKRTCAYTNSKIEHELMRHYHELNEESHPWARFDMIIVDEVHSLLADASFQSAPFYVRRLIEETLARSKTCKVIVMTGTPVALENDSLFDNAHCLDRMSTCRNVTPKRIEFITKKTSESMQQEMISSGTPFVSFMNHVSGILSFINDIPSEASKSVAISFSSETRREELKSKKPDIYNRMCRTEDYLSKHRCLPDDITAFISSARNKEGVNIKNDGFRYMFVEAHNEIDVIQMAGRLRNPVDILYIVVDSVVFHDMDNKFESDFSAYPATINAINSFYTNLYNQYYSNKDKNGLEYYPVVHAVQELGLFIDYIHEKFPYIRFDYFSNKFCYYKERKISKKYIDAQNHKFAEARDSPGGLISLVHQWYPNTPCAIAKKPRSAEQRAVDHYLETEKWLDGQRKIQDKERKQILTDINNILGKNACSLKSVLKRLGYDLQTNGKKTTSKSKIVRMDGGNF